MTKFESQYKYLCGEKIGSADDEKFSALDGASNQELIDDAVACFADTWPESDGDYDAVVWVEDLEGNLIVSEDVQINRAGEYIE